MYKSNSYKAAKIFGRHCPYNDQSVLYAFNILACGCHNPKIEIGKSVE